MERLVSFKVDPARFEVMKEINARSYRNFKAEQPYQHAVYHLALLLTENAWTKAELQEAAQGNQNAHLKNPLTLQICAICLIDSPVLIH